MFSRVITSMLLPSFVLSTFIFLSACSSEEEQAPMQMPPSIVTLTSPRMADLQETVMIAGSLVASQQAVLSSEREGVIRRIFVMGGQSVKTGQLLIQLSNDTPVAELKRAEADVKLRREERKRAQSLLKRNVNSQYDLDKAQAQLDTALANKELVNAELKKRIITAPFTGQLGIRKVNVGSYVQQGEALIELVSLNPLYVDFKIPETAISKVSMGDEIDIDIPALPNEKTVATVRSISPSVDERTRTVAIRATIDNSQLRLKPGLFAKIHLPIKSYDQVYWLPETSVFQEGNSSMVLLSEEGKARRVIVDVLSYQNGEVAIISGITETDVVVSAGHHKVPFDGMAIMTQEQMMQGMAAPENQASKNENPSKNPADVGSIKDTKVESHVKTTEDKASNNKKLAD